MEIVQPYGEGAEVSSINNLTGAITLSAGTNITLGTVGNTITINSSGSSGTPGTPVNAVQFNNPLGTFAGDASFTFTTASGLLLSKTFTNTSIYASFGPTTPPIRVVNGIDVYGTDNTINGVQIGVGNASNGIHAYSFAYMNNDLAVSADSTHYAGLGYTSSLYNDATFGTGVNIASQFQLWNTDGPTTFVNPKAAQYVNWIIGGVATTNEGGRLTPTGLTVGLAGTTTGAIKLSGATSGTTTLTTNAIATGTITLPAVASTDTVALLGTAQTFTALQQITLTTKQFQLNYDGSNNTSFTVNSTGTLSLSSTSGIQVLQSVLAGTAGTSNFYISAATGMVSTTAASYLFAGATTVFNRIGLGGNSSSALTTGVSYANTIIAASPVTTFTSGTHAFLANLAVMSLGTVTSGGATVTNTASLYIASAGAGGTSNYALYVASGATQLTGSLTVTAATALQSSLTVGTSSTDITVVGTTTAITQSVAQYQYAGSSTNFIRTGFYGSTSTTLTTGANYSAVIFGNAPITTFTSGTHAWLANVVVKSLGTVTSGGATVTNTASLYIDGAGSGGTNNYALVVNAGNNYYGGLDKVYNGIATTGWGTPAIYGYARPATGQTAAVTLSTYTVGAADGSFIVSANILVTASTTHSFTVTCTYTDESNTSRTLTLNFSQLTGTFLTAITNVQGVGAYEGIPLHIRCKASTTITLATAAGGTYTSVTYNGEGMITQIA